MKVIFRTRVFWVAALMTLTCTSPISVGSDQIADLNMIAEANQHDDESTRGNAQAADYNAAWNAYNRIKNEGLNSAYCRYAMAQMAVLTMMLPISEDNDEKWRLLLNDAGENSNWVSVFVRGIYICEMSNREASGENHGAKVRAAALLSGINMDQVRRSFDDDKEIINKSETKVKIVGNEIEEIISDVTEIRDK